MKKCGYCAKEISYHEMFCCDDCQIGSNKYFEKKEKFQKLLSVINGIFVIGIGIFLFLYAFEPGFGVAGIAVCLLVLGISYLLLPFPADAMIEKFKLKKAIFLTRVIAVVLLALGVLAVLLLLLGVL